MEKKKIVVLGSTGSIGTQTLEVCRWRGFQVVGLAAGKNLELALQQIEEFSPQIIAVDPSIERDILNRFPNIRIGTQKEVVESCKTTVVAAVPGLAGLAGVRRAVELGLDVALANKESMVAAGPLLWHIADKTGSRFLPVDSEHSALFQALVGEKIGDVAELILTASGGPFLHQPEDLSGVSVEMALNHPRWKMGPKVTIDSSTLFNKGLEVLEAVQLFRLPIKKVKVLIHPQSYVHSMVRFNDGNIKAQLGPTDMRLPIQYALTYPDRPETPLKNDPIPLTLDFLEPDTVRFPALELAFEAGKAGGLAPVVLNATDEIAVELFLQRKIQYLDIARLLEKVLQETPNQVLDWNSITEVDRWARVRTNEIASTLS